MGTTYTPICATVTAEQNTTGTTSLGHKRVDLGDWIVTYQDGTKTVFKDAKFKATFKPAKEPKA